MIGWGRRVLALGLLGLLLPACGGGGGSSAPPSPAPIPLTDGVLAVLPFRVVDAEYDRVNERLVLVTESPNRLHRYDPVSGARTEIELPRAPACVGLSPDGSLAAVGHDGWVTIWAPATGALVQAWPVSTDVLDVVLPGNGYAYAFPRIDQWQSIRCLNLATGIETLHTGSQIYAGARAKLRPGTSQIYSCENSSLLRWETAGGTAAWNAEDLDSSYLDDNLWISDDGLRVYTATGLVYREYLVQQTNLGVARVAGLDTATAAGLVAFVPAPLSFWSGEDTEVQVFSYPAHALLRRFALPAFPTAGPGFEIASSGRFVFFNAAASRLFVLVQAAIDPGLPSAWGVVAFPAGQTDPALGTPRQVVTKGSGSTIDLTWSPVAGATGYNMYRATVPGVTPQNYAGLPGGTLTSFVSPFGSSYGLAAGTTYYFVITATTAVLESAASVEVSRIATSSTFSPSPPTALAAVRGDRQVVLSWTPPLGTPPDSYTVYAGISPGPTKTQYAFRYAGAASPFAATGLENHTPYWFRVASSNAAGEGLESQEIVATPAGALPAIDVLSYDVIDAEYSAALNRIVMVSAAPDRLHVYNPANGSASTVDLPAIPRCVSVAPDGLSAAVGHDGSVSLVLLSGTPSLGGGWPITGNALDVVHGGNGFLYVMPTGGNWHQLRCVNTATGLETPSTGGSLFGGTLLRLQPGGTAIYGGSNNISPADVMRLETSAGTAAYSRESIYHGDFWMGGEIWFKQSGERLFTRYSTIFSAATSAPDDMIYRGSFGTASLRSVQSVAHSAQAGRIAAIPMARTVAPVHDDTEVRFFGDEYADFVTRRALPRFVVGPASHPGRGRFVFWRSDGSRCYVVLQADPASGLAQDWGVVAY